MNLLQTLTNLLTNWNHIGYKIKYLQIALYLLLFPGSSHMFKKQQEPQDQNDPWLLPGIEGSYLFPHPRCISQRPTAGLLCARRKRTSTSKWLRSKPFVFISCRDPWQNTHFFYLWVDIFLTWILSTITKALA